MIEFRILHRYLEIFSYLLHMFSIHLFTLFTNSLASMYLVVYFVYNIIYMCIYRITHQIENDNVSCRYPV